MSCWIRGCTGRSKNVSSSKKRNSLFKPRTEKMFNNWLAGGIAAKGINKLTKNSQICELHFQDDQIIREDVFPMADGSTITVPRKKPLLKEDAVPSVFPMPTPAKSNFYYVNLITEEERQKVQNERISTVPPAQDLQRPVSIPNAYVLQNPVAHNSQDIVANGDNLELQTWAGIISDLKNLTLPSEYWIPVFHEEFAMWTCWIEDLSVCQRNVILAKNMTYRVSIGRRQIDCLSGKVENADDMKNVLNKISNLHPCKDADNDICAISCHGYVIRDCASRGVQSQRCAPCAKHKSVEWKSKRPIPEQRLAKNCKTLRMRYKNSAIQKQKKNARLQKKVLRLQKEVENERIQCARANAKAVKDAVAKLPLDQQFQCRIYYPFSALYCQILFT